MANIRKSFNLRNGVQVDDDNFIVNPNGLVGIGTTIPDETLDVRGSVKVVGILTANNALIENLQITNNVNVGVTSISSGIISATSGIVTYYGDGGQLFNLPTSQWLDIDVGLGFTSIYAQGFVGVGTVDPRYLFQVGGNNNLNDFQRGVGINERGDINASGIITAAQFSGSGSSLVDLNASNVTSGTISADRLPIIPEPKLPNSFQVTGIITALGGFSGIAFTAANLTPNARVTIDHINSQTSEVGVSTISSRLNVLGNIGLNTDSPQSSVHIVGSTSAALQVTATQSSVLVGRSLNPTSNTGGLRFGNISGLYPYSTGTSLDLINYDTGNLNYYLHYGPAGVGTGNFNWFYAPDPTSPLMTLTYGGNLGLGVPNPTSKLEVSGNVSASSLNVSGDLSAVGGGTSVSVRTLYVLNGSAGILDANGNLIIEDDENFYATSGVSTFFDIEVTNNGIFNQRIGIGNTNPLGALHIGDYENDVANSILITPSGIGIGTDDLSGVDATFYAFDNFAVFGLIGIGTETIANEDTSLYIVGNSEFYGNLNVSGVSTFSGGLQGNVTGNINSSGVSTFSGGLQGNVTGNINSSGVSTFSGGLQGNVTGNVTGNLNSSGVTTSQNGFTSGIGVTNPVKITVSGSILTFTVVGVGSTSLTLF